MRRQRPDPIDAATAERLLRGEGGPPPLAGLLARATAAPTRAELAGEDLAVANFRAANVVRVQPGPSRPAASTWARLATVKVGAAVALALGLGGVALAAGTGILPGTSPGAATPTPVGATATSAGGPGNGHTGASGTDAAAPSTSPHPTATPAPQSLPGLCRAYLAQLASHPGKVPENPMFGELVAAASGAANVPAFCAALAPGPSAGSGTSPGRAGDHPTGHPTDHPPQSGQPKPTQAGGP